MVSVASAKTGTYPIPVTVTVSGPSGDPIPTGPVTLSTTYSENSLTLTNGSATFLYASGALSSVEFHHRQLSGRFELHQRDRPGTVTVLGAPSITLSPYYATGVVDQPLSMTVTVSGYLSCRRQPAQSHLQLELHLRTSPVDRSTFKLHHSRQLASSRT